MRGSPLRVALDATPLLGHVTGVGRYTAELLAALSRMAPGERPDELAATAFTWRGHDDLAAQLPPGVIVAGRRAPARLLAASWLHSDLPSMPFLGVRSDVFHGTNFVLPPPGRGAKGVVTIHDLAYLRMPANVSSASARYLRLVPRGLRHASFVLTPTQAIADEVMAQYRLEEDRVRVTPLGVDPAWFDAANSPRPDLPGLAGLPERYLLFVGAIEPRKDIATLLTAFRQLRRAEPDTPPLVLVGPQGWGPALETAGLTESDVLRVGYLDSSSLRPVVAHALILCYPSLYEGFGLPPLEALAAGTPVVASDIPAVREVVGDGGPGVRLVPVRDADALSQAISDLLARPPDPGPGRAHARRFAWSRTAELTLNAYRSAVA